MAKPVIVCAGIVILDQLTKIAVQQWMTLYQSYPLIGDVVQFTYIRNPGAAFGITFGGRWLYLVLSIVACAVMIYYLARLPVAERRGRYAIMTVLGGALGNLIDRALYGEVTDFIDIGAGAYRWPIFNVADSAVTIGIILLFTRLSAINRILNDEAPSG
ncbi:MAG: signal peptidase II [Gemmatimonadetes bacterium]|nr:signal peptidase II [Gemmatimonadota bacterium]